MTTKVESEMPTEGVLGKTLMSKKWNDILTPTISFWCIMNSSPSTCGSS